MEIHKDARRLIADLQATRDAGLLSVILYGSAARGDFVDRASDLNLILVLQDLAPRRLDAVAPAVQRWLKRGHPVPRLFSPDLIRASADVFPIEFLDIRAAHVVLHGADPFAGLVIQPDHLRLQCERELKEKLMMLREAYVAADGDRKAVRRLLCASYPSFTTLFRGCLRLMGEEAPAAGRDAVAAFCARAGIEAHVFETVERLRRGESGDADPIAIYAEYDAALSRAAEAVDRFARPQGGSAR